MKKVHWLDRLRLLRMPLALLSYVRSPRLVNPREEIRLQLAQREARFLDTLRRTVFADPRHPYRRMFEIAGCAYADLADAVRCTGLEAALEAIRRAGVYLTHDELKGRTPIVRAGRQVEATTSSWNNPLVAGGLLGMSSGSSGDSVRTSESATFLRYQEAHVDLVWRELGFAGRPHAELRPMLPSLRAFELGLAAARLGQPLDRWFPIGVAARDAAYYGLATRVMVELANRAGAAMPHPEPLPPNDFRPAAAWLAAQRAAGAPAAVSGIVSPAVRVISAALDSGLDIRGTTFSVGGETLTPAKRAVAAAAGTEIHSRYHITEIGDIGHACRAMQTGNSVHLYREAVAAITHRRRAAISGADVESLLFSTLLPSSPRILINVETDDSGVLGEDACDCAFARAGLTTVIRDLFSFGKLTGHGVTLVGTDLVDVLEQRLPAVLGGYPGDYQLVEREAGTQTEIILYVSPRVSTSAAAARQCFLDQLRLQRGGSMAAGLWTNAHAIQAVIAEPIAGTTGKVQSLHLLLGSRSNGTVPELESPT